MGAVYIWDAPIIKLFAHNKFSPYAFHVRNILWPRNYIIFLKYHSNATASCGFIRAHDSVYRRNNSVALFLLRDQVSVMRPACGWYSVHLLSRSDISWQRFLHWHKSVIYWRKRFKLFSRWLPANVVPCGKQFADYMAPALILRGPNSARTVYTNLIGARKIKLSLFVHRFEQTQPFFLGYTFDARVALI